MAEPTATAWVLLGTGILLAASVLLSRASGRLGVPVFLLFLVIGMVAGSEGIGGIAFDDYELAFRLGTIALCLILFDGGLNTPMWAIRSAGLTPAVILSTVGVIGTAGVLALGARLLGVPWEAALLVGAVVSSTDAAAVFSTLRASNLRLKKRVATTLEMESGMNDPMAVILTMEITLYLAGEHALSWWAAVSILVQLVMGGLVGYGVGMAGRWMLRQVQVYAAGLYSVLGFALAALAFSVATLLWGSGFLAVYVAGVVIGNSKFPFRAGLARFHDAAAWLSQVIMFVLLGLLVLPSDLLEVMWVGILISLVLVFVARPLVVALCLLPFRYSTSELAFISWVGLRGAVPIVLGIFPVLAGVPEAQLIFNIVFFIVVFTAIIPGATVGWLTRRLDLVSPEPPPPAAVLEINSMQEVRGELISFHLGPASVVCGMAVRDIPFPPGASAVLVVREESLLAPRADTVFQPGDHVYVLCDAGTEPRLELLFGTREE
jgi:cell volume regulation protein A